MTTEAPGQPDLVYRWDAGSTADSSAQWERATAEAYVPLSIRVDRSLAGGTGPEGISRVELGDVALVDLNCAPCSVARVRSGISRDTHDYIAVLLNLRGIEKVATTAANAVLPAGAVAFWDTRQTARFEVTTALTKRTLLIPRDVMREAMGPRSLVPLAPLTGLQARLFAGFLDVVADSAPGLAAGERLAARNAALDLLAGLARSTQRGTYDGATASLRPQIDRWLDRNLTKPLTPAVVAATHGISVRSLHRMFQLTGESVGDVIRRRRLERARQELLSTDDSVAAIAHRWLFADSSHFSRACRSEFGSAPVEIRASARPCSGLSARLRPEER